MDAIRVGRGLRAIRHRRGWRQEDLAREGRVSQSLVSRIELGQLDSIPMATMVRVTKALGATLDLRVQWHGESLDRLVDAAHASTVEQVVRVLTARGWEAVTEVSFSIYGERGSVDVLARHAKLRRIAVVEVKSRIGDVQATLVSLDRKVRNASAIARDRGWTPWPASRLLVVADSSTARRRIDEHAATFESVMPLRGPELRRWIGWPDEAAIGGVWFLSPTRRTGVRRRVRAIAPRKGPAHPLGG